MFKLLKKMYFKIYHLLKLIGVFTLIFGSIEVVNAEVIDINSLEVEECSNINHYKLYGDDPNWPSNNNFGENTGFIYGKKWSYNASTNELSLNNSNYSIYYKKLIILDKNSSYYSQYLPGSRRHRIYLFDKNLNYINYFYNDWTSKLEFSTPNDSDYYYALVYYENSSTNILVKSPLALYKTDVDTTNNNQLNWNEVSCPSSGGGGEEDNDEVYSNFLELYVNKMTYLASGFTENPYLMAMVSIIFAWVVLELFLKIINLRGGKR